MKNLKLLTAFLITIVWMGSCAKDDTIFDNPFNLGEAFETKANTNYSESNGDLSIRVNDVLTDSRCPINVNCISAGEIILELEIGIGDQVFIKEVNFPCGKEKLFEFGGYAFRLTKITPENQIDEEIELGDYKFTFLIDEL